MAKNPPRPHGEIVMPREPREPPLPRFGFFTPSRGYVLLAAVGRDATQAIVRLGRGSPGVTEGYGGWALNERPKNVALTEWAGGVPIQLTIPFTVGSLRNPHGSETEAECRALERLAGVGGGQRPPSMIFHSAGVIEHDYAREPRRRWVIEDLAWDLDEISRGGRGRRVWAPGTLVLREYIRDETLSGLAPATQRNRDNREPTRGHQYGGQYKTKDGDTLRKIAKHFDLGRDALREMKQVNNIRDADKKLPTGRIIRLPVHTGGGA